MNIAVFASGGGSNARAIYDAVNRGEIPGAVVQLLISNNSKCGAMRFAEEHHIPSRHLSLKKFDGDENQYTKEMLTVLAEHHIDLIVLAGYMKKLPAEVVREYRNRIINIHPSLLPKYGGEGMYGLNVHQAVIDHHERESGATVHYVEEEYDNGKIILQDRCPVYPNDTAETLQGRVKELEHRLYPQAIKLVAESLERK